MKKFIKAYIVNAPFAKKDIHVVSKKDLQKFFDAIPYPTSAKTVWTILYQVSTYLVQKGILNYYFMDGITKPKTNPTKKKRALTAKEVTTILNHVKGEHLELLFYFLFKCGMRVGEVIALQWDEIEILNNSMGAVYINATITTSHNGAELRGDVPKTSSSVRSIPFNDVRMVELIKANPKHSRYVFVSRRTGSPYSLGFIRRAIATVSQEVGIPFTSHYGRTSFASHLVHNHVPLTTVSSLLGHATCNMVINVYAKALRDLEKDLHFVSTLAY